METVARPNSSKPALIIRAQMTDGSVESFHQSADAEIQKIWQNIEPSRLFAHPRVVIAGDYSKTVLVTSQVVRMDFIHESFECWEFPGGYSDIVELSEADYRKHARLDQPNLMPKREERTPTGDLLVSFLKLNMLGGRPVFLMAEFPVKLPVENQSFMQFLLSKRGFHMRLKTGGCGVVNLLNLVSYTVHPGVADIPADAWIAEPSTTGQP